jgi:hypothetical protein
VPAAVTRARRVRRHKPGVLSHALPLDLGRGSAMIHRASHHEQEI